MSLSLVYSFCGWLVALTALLHMFLPKARISKPIYSPFLMMVALIILLLPGSAAPIFHYLRGLAGDFSVLASVFFGAFILNRGWGKTVYREKELQILFVGIGLLGIGLYSMTLGATQYDPYRLGYYPQGLLIILFGLGLYFWYRRYYFLLFSLVACIIGFTVRLLESNNLWDYLLDGVFWLICMILGIVSGLKNEKSRRPR